MSSKSNWYRVQAKLSLNQIKKLQKEKPDFHYKENVRINCARTVSLLGKDELIVDHIDKTKQRNMDTIELQVR